MVSQGDSVWARLLALARNVPTSTVSDPGKKKELTREADLVSDMGLVGDDAFQFMERYAETFGVERGDYDFKIECRTGIIFLANCWQRAPITKQKMNRPRKLACAVMAAGLALGCLPALAHGKLKSTGDVIAPPELVAAYSCTTYAEAVFLPKLKAHATLRLEAVSSKDAELKRLLSAYDGLLDGMCQETSAVFARHRDKVRNAYNWRQPGVHDNIEHFLSHPNAKRWASDTAAFLAKTAPLVQYYELVRAVALDHLQVPENVLDWDTISEVNLIALGMQAEHERKMLIILLRDRGFAKLAPRRFDLPSLKNEELRLRKEAAGLWHATGWFNDNASDLVRMHFNGFDVMREIGLTEIYVKYDKLLEKKLNSN